MYCAQVCFVAEQRKKKKQEEEEEENEKRVENKERERKGGETGGRGEGRVIGDPQFFSSAVSCLAGTGGLCPTVTGTH